MDTHTIGSPSDAQVAVAVETFKMLGDNTRLRILWTLLHGEHSVGEVADHIGAQPAAVSQHLAKLRLAHVVNIRRAGNKIFYAVDDAHVRHLVEEALFHSHHVADGIADHGSSDSVVEIERRQA